MTSVSTVSAGLAAVVFFTALGLGEEGEVVAIFLIAFGLGEVGEATSAELDEDSEVTIDLFWKKAVILLVASAFLVGVFFTGVFLAAGVFFTGVSFAAGVSFSATFLVTLLIGAFFVGFPFASPTEILRF